MLQGVPEEGVGRKVGTNVSPARRCRQAVRDAVAGADESLSGYCRPAAPAMLPAALEQEAGRALIRAALVDAAKRRYGTRIAPGDLRILRPLPAEVAPLKATGQECTVGVTPDPSLQTNWSATSTARIPELDQRRRAIAHCACRAR